ncbi:two component response regulator CtrA [Acetobacter malorum DSM 14337]|uniref:Two component response regulator CtrA n=1 Tax=Acetobacter malorum DSM 14337 TaxID=1307910 RepID=A0ABQ0PPV2_9PROT|nr:response regulator transcription factor [Acetobacter malorum]KXV07920.1 regulator [Acetobacter malorum]GBQ77734.1 two component response regulator CtrA [Acetobacter malorum DSM 14337]
MRILFAEDTATSARQLLPILKKAGLSVDLARSGRNTIEMLRNYDYGIAIIDLHLPDMDGYNVVNSLRLLKIQTPVIIISSLDQPEAKIRAFSMGADDYLTKPFDPAELVARIQAILRRSSGFAHPVIQVAELKLDLNSHTVMVHDQPVHLTCKEFSILELLVLRKGVAQTKETFLNHLYGGRDEPDIKIIDVFVCKLRKKLQAAGASDHLISTVWGKGYILNDPKAKMLSLPPQPAIPMPASIPEQHFQAAGD